MFASEVTAAYRPPAWIPSLPYSVNVRVRSRVMMRFRIRLKAKASVRTRIRVRVRVIALTNVAVPATLIRRGWAREKSGGKGENVCVGVGVTNILRHPRDSYGPRWL